MVRFFAGLVGLFFSGMLLLGLADTIYLAISEPPEETAEHKFHKHPEKVSFAHDGPFGHFDQNQLQRGLKVYQEVCAACHSMNLVAFRNFEDLGYNEDEIKAIAKNWATQVPSIDPNTGEATTRPGLPSDNIPAPHANEVMARAANNNALPPDLSLMAKARHNGPAYIYSLLTGYQAKQPAELLKEFPDAKTPKGLHYNPYFANLNIAMAPPLSDGQVSFDDGSKNDLKSMSKDVAAFLTWAAEPKMTARKQVGWAALIFLIIFTGLAYMSYKSIWADKKH
jgi:ubiquinol-cytochrome c reductase cytochrome c1 subunit